MKQTVDFQTFRDTFRAYGRNNFSRDGMALLFDYLEQYEADTGTEIELDVVALCCDYNEDHWENVAHDYSIDLTDCEDDDDKIEAVRDYLTYNTTVVGQPLPGVFLYQVF